MMEAAQQRLINEHNERAWLAWHIVALQNTKKLPKLTSLYIKPPRRQPQSIEEQKRVAKMIANTFRGIT